MDIGELVKMIRIKQTEEGYRKVLYFEYTYDMYYVYHESLIYTYGASPNNMYIDDDTANGMNDGTW